jgi:glycosyltransferase involved in cell wall biosynthesis
MTDYPRITIVTPSFNQGKYLRQTIESILNQDYPNLEYIIVDGGSTDDSVDIIKEYADKLSFWMSEKDNGQSHAINKGFKRATGDLLNWINSDDILFPGALYRIGETFIRNPQADLIVGSQAFGDENGYIRHVSAAPSRLAVSAFNFVMPFGQQSTFFTSRAYERVGGIREDCHAIMDHDFYYRVLTTGGDIARCSDMIGFIRSHPDAKTIAQPDIWEYEIPRFFREKQISAFSYKMAALKMRLVRCIDGSYLKSFLLLLKWKGKKSWNCKLTQNRREL